MSIDLDFRTGRRSRRLIALAAAVLAAAELGAAAGNKAPPPPRSWQFRPMLDVSVAHDETIIPRAGRRRKPTDTLATTVAPGFRLFRRDGSSYTALTYSFLARSYHDVADRDSLSHRVWVACSRRPSAKWGWRFTDYATYVEDTGGEEDDTIAVLSTYLYNRSQLRADYALARRWKLLLGAACEVRDYDEPVYDDSYTLSPSWGLQWRPNGRERWSLDHEFKYLGVDGQEAARTHRMLGGYATTLPWRVRLDARAGALRFQNAGTTYPAGRLALSRQWRKARLNLLWDRGASVSGYYGIVRRDYLSFRPRYQLDKDTELIGHVSLVLSESVDDNRVDTSTWRYGLTLRRRLTKSLTGDVGYTFVDQEAEGISGYDIAGQIVRAGLSARF